MPCLSSASKTPCIRSRSDSEPTRMPTTVSGIGDVATELHAGEIYARGGFICGGSGVRECRAGRSDVEDPARVRHEAAVMECGAGMEDECTGGLRVADPVDGRPGVGSRGVVGACQDDRDCGALRG